MRPSINRMRLGTEEKVSESVMLRAGLMAAEFVDGALRTIRYEDREVLRGIGYVVRNKDWGTDNPEISDCTIRQDADQFAVKFRGRCARAESGQILEYEAQITGNANGQLTFDVIAEPRTVFLTARCGFTVLHPLEGLAGQAAVVEHVDGSQEQATFPELIAPWQPFKEIRAIRHRVAPGITACCRLNGDVFEMEDQRAWSDASYKTYVRPLALPWPFVMEQGVRNRQSVELQITDERGPALTTARNETAPKDARTTVEIGEPEGIFPLIGVAIPPPQISAALAHPALLERLHPQLLLFHFDSSAGHGREHLDGFAEISRQSGGKLECSLELVVSAQRRVDEELREVAAMVAAAGLGLSSVLVSPAADGQSTLPGSDWPPCPPLAEIYHAARLAFSWTSYRRRRIELFHGTHPQAPTCRLAGLRLALHLPDRARGG